MFKLVLFLWITNGVSMTEINSGNWCNAERSNCMYSTIDLCNYAGAQAQLNSTIQNNSVVVGFTCVPDHNWQDK